MYHFTTFFDKNYLSRGLVLYDSLKENCNLFELYILCLDVETINFFENNFKYYPEIVILDVKELEEFDHQLMESRKNRTLIEYYFTLSPCLPLYILKTFGLSHICSLDADIMFFNKVDSIFQFLNEYSIIITPHKFSSEIIDHKKWGKFNVSFQIFKNDSCGVVCLKKWRDQCIDWCGDYLDEVNNRFADQKYLDTWISDYPGKVKVLADDVSGIAPWNLNNYKIEKNKNIFYSNSKPLIFFHFHSFKIISKSFVTNGFHDYKVINQKGVAKLYLNYWRKIEAKQKILDVSIESSARYKIKKNILMKILTENDVYYKFLNSFIFSLNFTNQYKFYKKIKRKFYGVFN